MKPLPSLAILLLLAAPAAAQPARLVISDGWFRSLPGKLPAAGYFKVRSNAAGPIAITGAEAEGCGMVMLHKSDAKGGMSSMRMVEKVTVPPGGSIAFAPGGYHLMCSDAHLTIGKRVPVTLHLSDGSSLVAAFQVRGATGK